MAASDRAITHSILTVVLVLPYYGRLTVRVSRQMARENVYLSAKPLSPCIMTYLSERTARSASRARSFVARLTNGTVERDGDRRQSVRQQHRRHRVHSIVGPIGAGRSLTFFCPPLSYLKIATHRYTLLPGKDPIFSPTD